MTCEDCWREAEVFNSEGRFCDTHSRCDECGKDPMQVGRHCFDCKGEMMCGDLGLQERLAA